jgi:hypothetical protein
MRPPQHTCTICNRKYYWKGEAQGGPGILRKVRRVGCRTCSKKCSRDYYSKGYNRKIMERLTNDSKNQ